MAVVSCEHSPPVALDFTLTATGLGTAAYIYTWLYFGQMGAECLYNKFFITSYGSKYNIPELLMMHNLEGVK